MRAVFEFLERETDKAIRRITRSGVTADVREVVDLIARLRDGIYSRMTPQCEHQHDPRLPCPWPECRAGVPGELYIVVEPDGRLLSTFVAATPPYEPRRELRFTRVKHSDGQWTWRPEEPKPKRERSRPASEADVAGLRVVMDGLLESVGSSADAAVGELLGVAKLLRALASNRREVSPGAQMDLEQRAKEIDVALVKVREIKSEPVAAFVQRLAEALRIELTLPPLALDATFTGGRQVRISVHGRTMRGYIRDMTLNTEAPDFEYFADGQMLTGRRVLRHSMTVTFDLFNEDDL